MKRCKFCGGEVSKYAMGETCGKCTAYCNQKCKKASTPGMSWHREPCISCKHNPYHLKHRWNGNRWEPIQ